MPLISSPEWDKSRERFAAWWERQAVDRVLLQVLAPSGECPPEPAPAPESLEQRWLDADWRIRRFEWEMSRTFYGGDAFPYLDTHIGPGTMSLYLGARPEFGEGTVWYHPCIGDIREAQVPEPDPDNPYWRFSREFARQGVERLKGKALVSFPDLIEGLDTLASLMGNEALLLALIEAPDDVHRFQDALTDIYFDFHDPLYNIIRDRHGGCCFSAFQTYAPGPMAKVQCDFSAMISPEMFAEFAVPYLDEQCARLDYAVYHLDGPCCLQHLDLLLEIPSLDAIQWTPGAGQPSACWEGYIPMYRRIREAGKSVMVRGGTPEEARALVEELGPEGLDIAIWVDSPATAEAVVRDALRWRRKS